MVALVDIDDTLAATQLAILRYINRSLLKPYKFAQMDEDFREGKNRDYQILVDDFLSQPELSLRVKAYNHAIPALKALKTAGYQVHIVSSRKENLHKVTQKWLKHNNLLKYVDFIHPRFSHQRAIAFKTDVSRKIKATVAFDDTLSVVAALAAAGVTTYLIDKPWNQRIELPDGVYRSRHLHNAVQEHLKRSKSLF